LGSSTNAFFGVPMLSKYSRAKAVGVMMSVFALDEWALRIASRL
jgi:hypothetical protein